MTRKASAKSDCHTDGKHSHPSHRDQIKRLNRINGQVEGIKKMIMDQRYCPEILTQISAASSALKSLQANVLETHLESCVQESMSEGSETDRKRKIQELMKIFRSAN